MPKVIRVTQDGAKVSDSDRLVTMSEADFGAAVGEPEIPLSAEEVCEAAWQIAYEAAKAAKLKSTRLNVKFRLCMEERKKEFVDTLMKRLVRG